MVGEFALPTAFRQPEDARIRARTERDDLPLLAFGSS